VIVVSEKACELCIDAGWSGRPSPSDSEASFAHDRYFSPEVQAPPSPLTSIEDDLDNDKIELDFPMLDAPGKHQTIRISIWCLTLSCAADSKGRHVRQSERIRAREEKVGAGAQTRTTGETRGRPTSTRRR